MVERRTPDQKTRGSNPATRKKKLVRGVFSESKINIDVVQISSPILKEKSP